MTQSIAPNCKNYLGKKQSAGILSIMDRSADVSPIELLWEQPDGMVHKCPSSQSNLRKMLQEAWWWWWWGGGISSDYLNLLFDESKVFKDPIISIKKMI